MASNMDNCTDTNKQGPIFEHSNHNGTTTSQRALFR